MPEFEKASRSDLAAGKESGDAVEPSVSAQAARLVQLDPKSRQELILSANQGLSLVRTLSSETLLYTMKEIGINDAIDLLGMASPQQVRDMLDLDCWRHDHLDDKRVLRWLMLLDESGSSKLAEWFLHADVEWLVVLIQRHLDVLRKSDVEDDPDFDRSKYFTFDDQYLLRFRGEPEPILHALLERVYALDQRAYLHALENSLFELSSGLEEDAYRWRMARLADRGYPTYEEARALFRLLPPDAASNPQYRRDDDSARPVAGEDAMIPPDHALALLGTPRSFFASALAGVSGEMVQHIGRELAYLTNGIVTAEARDTGEVDEIRRCAETAHNYVNIGLAFAAGEDETSARTLLQSTRLQAFFQTGWGLLRRIQHAARGLAAQLSSSGFSDWEQYLDTPYREACAGLRAHTPLYFVGLEMPGEILSRRFAQLAELHRIESLLVELPVWFRVLRGCGMLPEQKAPDGVTLSVLWNTAFARCVCEGEISIHPLSRSDLHTLHERLNPAALDERWPAFTDLAARQAELTPAERPALDRLAALARERFEEVLAVDPETVELRFLDGVLVEMPQHVPTPTE